MHTHMEMLLPTCRPHFQGKEGPAPHLREKGQRNQGLTAFFKASLPLPVNQIFPPQLTAWVLRDKVTEKRGVKDPCSPSHVWPAEGEESKPSQFRELSLVQGAPQPSQLRVYSRRRHCIDFLSRWMWGRWRGQKLEHKMPSFQQVPLCMKRERKKEDNEEAIERRAHGLLLESSLSLQVVN